ncbi:hypothetical protein K438DRAFT_1960725 [Mycena galopus ATCC 62051]|nr:hypothetical protein K438DRAFT_1960725 [Mycena galopus ATCC 62051]
MPPAPDPAETASTRSAHAEAQARYRDKLRERRKQEGRHESPERNERGETYAEFIARSRAELRASWPDYEDFREYCDKVMVDRVHVNYKDPAQVAEFEEFLSRNPCVKDLGPNNEMVIDHWYRQRDDLFPEWKEELADYRDILKEYTSEQLDKMQLAARAKLPSRCIILARGGF